VLNISPEHVSPGYQVGWAEGAEVPAPLDEEQPLLICPVAVRRRLRCGRNIYLQPQHQSIFRNQRQLEPDQAIGLCCTPADEQQRSPDFVGLWTFCGPLCHRRCHAPDREQLDPRRPVTVQPHM